MDPAKVVGKLTKIPPAAQRTLLFDRATFIWREKTETTPEIKYQIYTVPGLSHLGVQRRIVLQGADGLILMIDGERTKWAENKEALKELIRVEDEHSKAVIGERILVKQLPYHLVLNKMDLPPELQIRSEEIPVLIQEVGPAAAEIFADANTKITATSTFTSATILKELIQRELTSSDQSINQLPEPIQKIEEPINKLMEQLCSKL